MFSFFSAASFQCYESRDRRISCHSDYHVPTPTKVPHWSCFRTFMLILLWAPNFSFRSCSSLFLSVILLFPYISSAGVYLLFCFAFCMFASFFTRRQFCGVNFLRLKFHWHCCLRSLFVSYSLRFVCQRWGCQWATCFQHNVFNSLVSFLFSLFFSVSFGLLSGPSLKFSFLLILSVVSVFDKWLYGYILPLLFTQFICSLFIVVYCTHFLCCHCYRHFCVIAAISLNSDVTVLLYSLFLPFCCSFL